MKSSLVCCFDESSRVFIDPKVDASSYDEVDYAHLSSTEQSLYTFFFVDVCELSDKHFY